MSELASMNEPRRSARGASVWLAVLAPVLCLLPFVDKAFHIDDPVYLWGAEQIQTHPLDFYGFEKSWSFFDEPMYEINKNPPGVSYFLAVAAAVFGWSEVALHLVFLLPVLALSFGMFRLGERLTRRPGWAVVLAMTSPVVIVSSSNVMSDTLTLALSVWAMVFWLSGIDEKSARRLWIATGLLSLAVLTKYLAICFAPLMVVYALMSRAPMRRWLLPFCVPVIAIGAYQLWTYRLYGINLLGSAASFSASFDAPERDTVSAVGQLATGLSFAGGCYIGSLFFLPVLWSPLRALAIAAVPLVSLVILSVVGNGFVGEIMHPSSEPGPGFVVQLALFVVAGCHIGALAVADFRRERNATSAVLALWVFGFFIFSTYVNWTVNGRTMLPMAPAVGLLLVRRLDFVWGDRVGARTLGVCSLLGVVIAMAVAHADYALAGAGRTAAKDFSATRDGASGRAWIQGNWGARWYFEAAGAAPFDAQVPSLRVGDTVIQSSNNLVYPLPEGLAKRVGEESYRAGRWVTTMDRGLGAGFYSSVWGPLPYAFGRVPDERYYYFLLDPR